MGRGRRRGREPADLLWRRRVQGRRRHGGDHDFAGGGIGGDGGPAATASLRGPTSLCLDTAGNVYIAETDGNRVRVVDTSGIIHTLAGDGTDGFTGDGGDARLAKVGRPYGVTVDAANNVYVTSLGRLRRIDHSTGIITTVAGNGEWRFGGDGGPRSEATFHYPAGAAAGAGGVFVADRDNRRVRRIDGATGLVNSLSGPDLPLCTGVADFFSGSQCPASVAVDPAGNVYAADLADFRVRKIAAGTGVVTDFAGNGTPGASGDGGPATAASIGQALGLGTDPAGNLFIADFTSHRVRRVDAATRVITTVAGTGVPGFSGDGGPARTAQLSSPASVATDGRGNVLCRRPRQPPHPPHRRRRDHHNGGRRRHARLPRRRRPRDRGIALGAHRRGRRRFREPRHRRPGQQPGASGRRRHGRHHPARRQRRGRLPRARGSRPGRHHLRSRSVSLDASGELFVVDQLHHRILQVGPPTARRNFYTVPPCRLVDTRDPPGPAGGPALSRALDRSFGVTGRCQVPSTAMAVSLNVTVVGAGSPGDLRFYPGGGFVPAASVINYATAQTRANNAVLALGSGGDFSVKVDQAEGLVHLVVDVNGYFQ